MSTDFREGNALQTLEHRPTEQSAPIISDRTPKSTGMTGTCAPLAVETRPVPVGESAVCTLLLGPFPTKHGSVGRVRRRRRDVVRGRPSV